MDRPLRPTALAMAAGLAAGLLAAPARAQSAAEIAVARQHFAEASKLEKAGKWAAAEKKLRQAVEIKETPGLRYHLAFTQEQQGKLVEALVDYDRAAELLELGAEAPDVAELVGPARERVRARVPTLTVKIATEGAELSIDGERLKRAVIGSAVPLNPGAHQLEVNAAGHAPFLRQVELAEAERELVEVELRPRPDAKPATESDVAVDTSAPERDSARSYVLIGEAGLTAIGLGVGIGYTIARSSADDRVASAQQAVDAASGGSPNPCATPGPDLQAPCRKLSDAADDRSRAGTMATVGFVVAGVGAAALVTTLLVWEGEPDAEGARVALSPQPGGGFVSVGGRF